MTAILVGIGVLGLADKKTPTVVDSVDVERYMGRWYAIASIPTSFDDLHRKRWTFHFLKTSFCFFYCLDPLHRHENDADNKYQYDPKRRTF